MKKFIFLVISVCFILINVYSQSTLELTFTAINNTNYTQLDSIKVMNQTQGGDTTLFWPDTVLILNVQIGITEMNNQQESLLVFQNYPNPAKDQTIITLYLPEKGEINLIISDLMGRKVTSLEKKLSSGYHSFKFIPGADKVYFCTAIWKGNNYSIKILTTSNGSKQTAFLQYFNNENNNIQLNSITNIQQYEYSLGDKLLYIGYAEEIESGLLDIPEYGNEPIFALQFADNIPCPGIETINHGGQVYNTIQIRGQCWLKENLNIGNMIAGEANMQNDGIIEKYCYNNDETNCTEYGGFYQWNEMMDYNITPGSQGICPDGWHIPTDGDWKILEGSVDSEYGIGNPMWDQGGYLGFDVGTKLKSTTGWINYGNGTDDFGFTSLPAGYRYIGGGYTNIEYISYTWSSTKDSYYDIPYFRSLLNTFYTVYRNYINQDHGLSVRCIKD